MTRFRVSVNNYPLTGLVDTDHNLHTRRPVDILYRAPRGATTKDGYVIPDDGWLTERELQETYGMTSIPKNWQRRRYPRTDMSSYLFDGIILEAPDEPNARDMFKKRFKIKTADENFQIEPTEDAPGLVGPRKMKPDLWEKILAKRNACGKTAEV